MSAPARPDDRLSFTDQLLFLGQRATEQELVAQIAWVYEHAVDMDALRRFHRNLGHGLIGRRIERSPLPFGRHRWVSSVGAPLDIDVAEHARPRAEFSDWLDDCAQMTIDPEWGPEWRLSILPMTDGSTGVSLVASHCLADGVGVLRTVVDAVKGNLRDLGYSQPRSRSRLRAVADDLRQTARGAPEVVRTLVVAAKQAIRRRDEITRSAASPAPARGAGDGDVKVVLPAITVYVDLDEWDDCANSLGGNSHSLIAAFAAKLGERLGRRRADGAVSLHIPISDRTEDDTRANAVSLATAGVDPSSLTTDLSGARVVIKESLKALKDHPDETLQLLPLAPFIPKWMVKRGSDVVFSFADRPVSCSNLGDLDPVVTRIDGTDAEYVMLRGLDRHVTRRFLERRGGLLTVLAGRIGSKMSLTIVAYQPGGTNTKPHVRDLAAQTLGEFGLTGVIQ